jgi:hypothetical protein
MLRSKVVNRGVNNTKIAVISMQAGEVRDFRLAFNMRGFPPIEPAMGGISSAPGESCHGALIEMEAGEYEKIWISEGGVAAKSKTQLPSLSTLLCSARFLLSFARFLDFPAHVSTLYSCIARYDALNCIETDRDAVRVRCRAIQRGAVR